MVYKPDMPFKESFYKSALKWNSYQKKKLSSEVLDEIIVKVSKNMDDLSRLTLDLAEYRVQHQSDWKTKKTLVRLESTYPSILKKDFETAIKIRFGRVEKLKGGDSSKYYQELFQKNAIRRWMIQHAMPYYRTKIYVYSDAVEECQKWMAKRFTYLAKKHQNKAN